MSVFIKTSYIRFGPCPFFPLAGNIPPELGKLHDLEILALAGNNIDGELSYFPT